MFTYTVNHIAYDNASVIPASIRKIEAVIFDFGGVVVNESFQDWISEHIALYQTIQNELLPLQDIVDRGDASVMVYKNYLSRKTGKNPDKIEKEILQAYEINSEAKSLIQHLRKNNIKTAIISNFPNEWFSKIKKRLSFDRLFNEIFVSSTFHLIKPDPAFFHMVLNALKVTPEQTVFTDDKKKNIDAAAALGIHSYIFTSANALKNDLRSLGIPL